MVTSKLGKEFIVVPGASRHLGNNAMLGSHNVNLQAEKFRVEKTTPGRRRLSTNHRGNEEQPAPGHTSAWGRQTM